jgi:DNA polymerase-3 subunit epsilon
VIAALKNRLNRRRLRDPNYAYLFEPYEGDEVVVLDTETTGLDPRRDAILSIGAVVVRKEKILMSQSFERFIRPEGTISEASIKIHHLRACDLEGSEASEPVIRDLLSFVRNRPIVGYYIGFDHAILSRYVRDLIGVTLPNPVIELSSMYYRRYRKSSAYEFVDLKFDTIMEALDLPQLGKHDALNDALMSAMMYLKLRTLPEHKGAYG